MCPQKRRRSVRLTRDLTLFAVGVGTIVWGAISLRPDVAFVGVAVIGLPGVLRGQERLNGR